MEEIFKDIEGYEDSYQISNLGRVRTKIRRASNYRTYPSIIRKPRITEDGYYKISLCKNGKSKGYYIHRLVAKSFIENPNNLSQVNHINGVKTDNSVTNLEWCSRNQNMQHASITHLMQHGEDRPSSVLTEKQVLEIYKLKGIKSGREIGELYGISKNTALLILRGKKWKYLYNQYFK